MITSKSLKNARKYCNTDISQIEGYEDAIASDERYTCHHVLEHRFYVEDLQKMNMYENVSPEFLIWMPFSVHHNNCWLHKSRLAHNRKLTSTAWNKGLTKETDARVAKYASKCSASTKGKTPWNKGLRKEV